jgi:Tol biopolymer transport system component/tRNA A-37 threonylcarbamoyl transferase component Bud32
MTTTIAQLSARLTGRYTIEREIGAGGMATVYLARDLRHERRVALKVLKPELGAMLGSERFLSEIRVTANLQHPNLLPLFDSGEASGLLYYVMPFVDGESLRSRLDREKQLPIDEAVRIASAVASALDYAHTQGVIHRDLKPENILLQSGQPVIADFGIALAVSNAGGARVTQTGLSLGTPQYMSPEQATGDRAVDGRSDIYSLAAVTYEMLAGEPPHTGTTAQAVIARVLTEQPRSLRATRPNLPEHVELAIAQSLSKLPADRWATAGQFADALQGKRTVDRRTVVLATSQQDTWRARFKDPVVWTALGIAVAATVFGVSSLRRPAAEEERNAVSFELTFGDAQRLAAAAQLAISPDGKSIVYPGLNTAGQRLLFLRELKQLDARALPGTDNGLQPFFSPDGEWLGFVAANQLKKVNLATGTVLTVATLRGQVQNPAWGSKDRIVGTIGQQLIIIPANGGEPRQFTALDTAGGETAQRGVRVLPDGETVLFLSSLGSLAETRIGITTLSTGSTDYLDIPDATPIGLVDGSLAYVTRTGVLMAVPFNLGERRVTGSAVTVAEGVLVTNTNLARAWISNSGSLVYRSGSTAGPLMREAPDGKSTVLIEGPREYRYPRLSPDGKRIALTIVSATGADVWIYDIAAKTSTKLSSEGTRNERAEWTPDGKRVLYISNRTGANTLTLWWQNADFSGQAEILQAFKDGQVEEGLISPDSQYLVYRTNVRDTGHDIWYRRLHGDTTAKPVANTQWNESGPRLSHDGKWIAYSASQDARPEVYVQPFPPSGPRYQVSTNGGASPLWARDGRRLFYASGTQLRVADVVTHPGFAVTSRDTLLSSVNFNTPVHANYDVTPDGGLLWSRSLSADAPTIVVHNWKYELRQRMNPKR